MILLHRTILIIAAAALLTSIKAQTDSAPCNQSCGEIAKSANINYPFGFSDGCPIKLRCHNDTQIKIGEFEVFNVTRTSIFVRLPAQCNRSINSIRPLFGPNFGPTRTNAFILQNCRDPLGGCFQPSFLNNSFGTENCRAKSDNTTCFTDEAESTKVMTFEEVNRTNCDFILSSVATVDYVGGLLQLQALELGWWLNGSCDTVCGDGASCERMVLPGGAWGTRCHCNESVEENWFALGGGCRTVIPLLDDCTASSYLSRNCRRNTKVGVLIAGLIGGASLMGGLIVVCYLVRRKSASLKKRMSTKRLLSEVTGSSNISLYQYKDIDRATDGFSETHKLGTGAYGTVYAANLHHDSWVAIKRIKRQDTESVDQVMNEVKLLTSVSHPNLVRLLGCCIENHEQILVYEYMPNGTLSQHLMRERGRGLPWPVRVKIAAETAQAIAYLHSEVSPPIYHRDIKSSNILLDYSYNSRVADFGLSRLGMIETDDSHISTAPQGTPGYVDPQYHQNFHLSDKSDVYSFGVVLVEIITAMKVVDFGRAHSEVNLAALAVDRIGRGCIEEMVDPTLDMNRDAWTLTSIHRVAELAFQCLAFLQDMRPSMVEVAEELERIQLSRWAPSSEDNMCSMVSSKASSCSSPNIESEKSFGINMSMKKGNWRLSRPPPDSRNPTAGRSKELSTLGSVNYPWLDEKGSPSANGLLSNMVVP